LHAGHARVAYTWHLLGQAELLYGVVCADLPQQHVGLALCVVGESPADFGAGHQGQCDDGECDQNFNQRETLLA
jgi:hypothetical protein